ncbi:MAG: Uma2 family endonuclease [Symploca sp. SIO2C1]|nr:Uma2 family endonuclease [Symploca sp. SIO2C1]
MSQPSPAPYQSVLPTMYDVPSEEVGDPGLPDEFHRVQAELLSETCRSPLYPAERLFKASDLNLYYDSRNPRLYKRPDWFLALDVPCFDRQQDLRWSYLVWQESVNPFLVIELLSPGTEADDLGEAVRRINQPPGKWDVYERFLRIPYYAVYDRYHNQFRVFRLEGTRYQELQLPESGLWFEELELGLGTWDGKYQEISGLWLRWYNAQGEWLPTQAEQLQQERQRVEQAEGIAQQERQRAEQEQQRAEQAEAEAQQTKQQYEQLLEQLRAKGIDLEH